jgi:hypothetical protein
MQTTKNNGIDWTKETQQVWRLKKELDKGAVCHQFYSTYTASALPTKLLEGLEFKIGQVIQSVK